MAEYVSFDESRLDAEAKAFYRSWLDRNDAFVGMFGAGACTVFHLINIVTDYFVLWPRYYAFMWKMHAVNLVCLGLFFLSRREMTLKYRCGLLFLQFFSITFYWYILFDVVRMNPAIDMHVVKAWTGYLTLSIFTVLMSPFHNWITAAYALVLYALEAWIWRFAVGGQDLILIVTIAYVGASLFQWAMVIQAKKKAVAEFETRQQLRRAEQAKIERELALARDIQDSFKAPSSLICGSFEVECHQRKNAKVGGDWVALRQTGAGDIVVLVADATGKGMQAALVVHAVQSLWAEALEEDYFNPREWLDRVNKALFRLGRNKPHSMTMGILVLNEEGLTYWSAGHLPLYMVVGSPSAAGMERRARVLLSGGDILGIHEELHLGRTHCALTANSAISLLVGTDGVFEKGTRYSPPEILDFHSKVVENCADALESCPADDDKTLVWIRREPLGRDKGLSA